MTTTIGRYEVRAELGRGGMATVYRGYDPSFGREVAIKVLPASFLHDPSFRSRFEREARTIAGLEHPAIVPVHDVGEHEGQPYLVMRLMKGSLEEKLREGPLAVAEAATLFTRLASALDQAHSQGIVHRDLKPGNILFDAYGAPYISDFGIVKLSEASEKLSMSGSVMGTPSYMSPEQAHGDQALDGRSDVYTMGVILFEILTGKTPYQAETPVKMMMKHVLDPVPRILSINPNLPFGTEAIIDRAMAKDPKERYATAGEMALSLNDLAQNRVEATLVPGTMLTSAPPVALVTAATEVLPATPAKPLAAVPAPPAPPPIVEQPVHASGRSRKLLMWIGSLAVGAFLLVCSCAGLGILIEKGVFEGTSTTGNGAGRSATATPGGVPPSPPVIAVGGVATPLPAPGTPSEGEESASEAPPADGALPAPQETEPPPPAEIAPFTPEPRIGVEDAILIQDAPEINSFHLNILIEGEGPAFENDPELPGGQMLLEADIIQNPPGYALIVAAPNAPPPNRFEFRLTGGQAFGNADGRWLAISPEEAPDIQDFMFLELDQLRTVEGMEFVGTEELNGQRVAHFQGSEETLIALKDEDDIEQYESGQIDLWLDERTGVILKLEVEGVGMGFNESVPDAHGSVHMLMEYSNLGIPIEIPPPPLGPAPQQP
ncbi:MAG: protein kinase [Ardenticatenales bacterium]|nr:protein kinase [Ardenticatenales bacterium]